MHRFCVFQIFVGHAKAESDAPDALFHSYMAPHICRFPLCKPNGPLMDREPV